MDSFGRGSPFLAGRIGKRVLCHPLHYPLGFPKPTIRIQGVDIFVDVRIINEVMRVSEVLNTAYNANLKEMDMKWLMDLLVAEKYSGEIY